MYRRSSYLQDPVQILESNNERFVARFTIPKPQLQEVYDAGEDWTALSIPGLADGGGQPGEPAVPMLRRLIAVPSGATPYISHVRPSVYREFYLNLYPYQPLRDEISTEVDRYLEELPPRDLFDRQAFVKDESAYERGGRFPRSLARVSALGSIRDLRIAVLECASGQYRPSTNNLQIFESIEVGVAFKGGTGKFITARSLAPFESCSGIYSSSVINAAVIADHVDQRLPELKCAGEELLILTHPDYRKAADLLASHRNDFGVPTNAFYVNAGSGGSPNTKEEIRSFIHARYSSCVVRPSYVLLFGDVPEIPTWVIQRINKPQGDTVATDMPYGTLGPDPYAWSVFPDFAVGRIPVNSASEAEAVVEKIIKYELDPPPFAAAYHNAAIASYFQCCRDDVALAGVEDGRCFILNAEFLRNSLLDVGYNVERIYNTNASDVVPAYFGNSTALPPELGPGSGYPWDGSTQDVIDSINVGRSLVFHIDHGGTSGWGDPPFGNWNVPSLKNEFFPLVFDMDCSSGNFESTCFAEVALKPANAGAIGVFGWTRMSNTKYYRSLLEGVLNAVWPDAFPALGVGPALPKRRLGDILNLSKFRMAESHTGGDPQAADYPNTVNHERLFHLLGDPTLEVWTSNPFKLPEVPELIEFNPIEQIWEIHYREEGAVITALSLGENGSQEPVGRAMVHNGVARIKPIHRSNVERLAFSAKTPNGIATRLLIKEE